MSIASSSDAAWMTDSTGPKISSRATSMSGVTPSRIVGPTNAPSGLASGRRPSTAMVAPASAPRSIHATIRSRAAHETTGPTSVPLLEAVADRELLGARDELVDQRPLGVADGDDDRAGHAALAGGAERRADDVRDGLRHDRVGHDDHEVLGAAQGLHALAVGRRPLVDVLGHLRRADERDRVDAGVVEQAVHDVDRAVHEVDDAVGKPAGLVDQVEEELLGQRHLLGRLQHERVPAGDRERQEPERHHRREVERHDRRAHARRAGGSSRSRHRSPRSRARGPASSAGSPRPPRSSRSRDRPRRARRAASFPSRG